MAINKGRLKDYPVVPLFVMYALAGLVIYSRVIMQAGFVFDDFEYVVGNQIIQDMSVLLQNFSDPRQFGYFSFALNYWADGENPLGYHLVNVVIHIFNGALVFYLVQTLLGFCGITGENEDAAKMLFWFPASAGLLFIVHPLQTQAVSYVTQRFTSLAAFFYLFSLVFYFEARRRMSEGSADGRSKLYYVLALLSTVAAMKVKEIAFTLPFVIAIADLLFFKTPQDRTRFPYFIAPFIASLVIVPFSILGPEWGFIDSGIGIAETTRKEKILDLTERPVAEYFLTQLRVLLIYIKLIFFPYHQSVVYDVVPSRTFFDIRVMTAFVFHLGLIGAALYSWIRSMKASADTAPFLRLIALGIGWFYITASVESSFIPIKDLIFEHRAYLPGIGLILAVLASIYLMRHKLPVLPEKLDRWLLTAVFVVSFVLGSVAYARNSVWLSELNLWDDVVEKVPDKAIGYNNRGNIYSREGKYELALADINRTISFFEPHIGKPGTWETSDYSPSNMSKTYINRAATYRALGNIELAFADEQTARNIISMPLIDLEGARKNAEMYFINSDFSNAIEECNRIISMFPNDLNAINNRGVARLKIGDKNGALEDFKKACAMGLQKSCESMQKHGN